MPTASVTLPAWRKRSWFAYLELMRPPNMLTAIADSLAGSAVAFAVAGHAIPVASASLLAASACLYAGGVVMNDVFDWRLDVHERPERPLPSGRASCAGAALLGALLLIAGTAFAANAGPSSLLLAAAIALLALLYDVTAKHHFLAGPLCMGLCRGLNLLLGMSAAPEVLFSGWSALMLLPMTYVAAITVVSRGEVHGGRRVTGWLAVALLSAVIAGLALLTLTPEFSLLSALPFLALLAWRTIPPFVHAAQRPDPGFIRIAVKAGVLSVICVGAVLGAGFAGVLHGLMILLLLPASSFVARLFAVT